MALQEVVARMGGVTIVIMVDTVSGFAFGPVVRGDTREDALERYDRFRQFAQTRFGRDLRDATDEQLRRMWYEFSHRERDAERKRAGQGVAARDAD